MPLDGVVKNNITNFLTTVSIQPYIYFPVLLNLFHGSFFAFLLILLFPEYIIIQHWFVRHPLTVLITWCHNRFCLVNVSTCREAALENHELYDAVTGQLLPIIR